MSLRAQLDRRRAIAEVVARVLRAKCTRISSDHREHIVDLLAVTPYSLEQIARAGEQLASTETSYKSPIAWEYWVAAFAAPTYTRAQVNALVAAARKDGRIDGQLAERGAASTPATAFADRRGGRTEWEWMKRAHELETQRDSAILANGPLSERARLLERELLATQDELTRREHELEMARTELRQMQQLREVA